MGNNNSLHAEHASLFAAAYACYKQHKRIVIILSIHDAATLRLFVEFAFEFAFAFASARVLLIHLPV